MNRSQDTIEQVLLSLLADYEKLTAKKIEAANEELRLEKIVTQAKTEIILSDPDYAAQKNSETRSAYLDSKLFNKIEQLWLARQESSNIGMQLDLVAKKISVYKRLLEARNASL